MSKVLHTRVYKRSRKSHGKVVVNYRGYYTLEQNGLRAWKSLGTPDKAIAEKRIMEFALQAQRESEGLIPPRPVRETASKSLTQLTSDYESYLTSRELARKHVHNTITRIGRIIKETRWRGIIDVRPDSFLVWRASLTCSAKTKKEYQISLNAFLNWLVRSDRLSANPLAKVDVIQTRGKQVRPYRAFTEDELSRLFAVAGKRLLAYQMLLYTGQRKSEVRALVWGDLHLDSPKPYVLFREATMKDDEKRAVPLRIEIAEKLRAMRPVDVDPSKKVFWFCWPTYDILQGDLKRAGIERKDGIGRVVHFHSFRKTMQSLGVRCGINQRAAQEILGHSDANLTAQAYTDVASLQLHDEIAKLPWITPGGIVAQHGAQNSGVSGPVVSLADILRQLQSMAQATGTDGVGHQLAPHGTPGQIIKLAARVGIEPTTK
jgi:integrase